MQAAKARQDGMMTPPRGDSNVGRPSSRLESPREAYRTYDAFPGRHVASSTRQVASTPGSYMGFAGRGSPILQPSRGRAQEREYSELPQQQVRPASRSATPQHEAQPASRSVTPTSARLDSLPRPPREAAASGLRIPMLSPRQETEQPLPSRMQPPEEVRGAHRQQYSKNMATITPVPDARGGTWRAQSSPDRSGYGDNVQQQSSPRAAYVSGKRHSTIRYTVQDESVPIRSQSPPSPRQKPAVLERTGGYTVSVRKPAGDEQYYRPQDEHRHQDYYPPHSSQGVRDKPYPLHSHGGGSPRDNVAPRTLDSPRRDTNPAHAVHVREQQAATLREREQHAFRGENYRGFSNVITGDRIGPTERNASAVLRELASEPLSPELRHSPRSPRSSPKNSHAPYATGVIHERDGRVDDLVNAVMILREEVMRLRDGNSTEFTMHANAIASVRQELTDLRNVEPVSVMEDEGIARKISDVSKIHEQSRSELQNSVTELREYIDKTIKTKDETTELLQQRVRELQESLESRAEEVEEMTERLETLENQDAKDSEQPGGYIAADGRRLSTMTELMDECKARVLDDLLMEMRNEVDALKTRIRSMERDVEAVMSKDDDLEAIEGLQLQIDRLNEKVQGVIKNNQIAGVASRIDDVEAMHLRLEQKVSASGDSTKLASAVENQRIAIAELSQNISALSQKVESRDKCAAKLKNHVSELVNALSTLQTQVSWLLTHHSDHQCTASKEPAPCANPYIAILPQSLVNTESNGTGLPGTPALLNRRLDERKSCWKSPVAQVPQTTNIGSTVRAIKCPCSPSISPTYTCSPRLCSPPPATEERQSAGQCRQAHTYTFSGCKRGFSPHAECRSSPNGDRERSPRMQTRWLDASRSCPGMQPRLLDSTMHSPPRPQTSPYRERLAGKIAGMSGGNTPDGRDGQGLENRVKRLEGFHRQER
eukprot:GEMP01011559.1.p1 GENE.GEMP01011559.1~~GEMP01011559.1.p1  ORF type:complete len:942 (+),score=248.04 GEMP01011559.1:218-3043(+)